MFGRIDGDVMTAAMEYDRDGLKARKAWFFYPGGIVCLGACITMDSDSEVVTTVNQCNFAGEYTSGGESSRQEKGHSLIFISLTDDWNVLDTY